MEVQLNELIEQIKKEGVEAAESQAKEIIDAANAEAEKIISEASAKAEKLMADAKAENERFVKSSEEAIKQAGRNLLISFRESVARELKAIVGENVSAVYSSEAFSGILVKVMENWSENSEADGLELILGSEDLKAFEENLISALKEKMLGGITLRAGDNFDGGFRIAVDGGSAYYDYSTAAVVDMLSNYLSPRVCELLKEAE